MFLAVPRCRDHMLSGPVLGYAGSRVPLERPCMTCIGACPPPLPPHLFRDPLEAEQ